MGKIIKLEIRQHVYDLSNCSGCGKRNVGEHIEISFPVISVVKHKALCLECYQNYLNDGVVNA